MQEVRLTVSLRPAWYQVMKHDLYAHEVTERAEALAMAALQQFRAEWSCVVTISDGTSSRTVTRTQRDASNPGKALHDLEGKVIDLEHKILLYEAALQRAGINPADFLDHGIPSADA